MRRSLLLLLVFSAASPCICHAQFSARGLIGGGNQPSARGLIGSSSNSGRNQGGFNLNPPNSSGQFNRPTTPRTFTPNTSGQFNNNAGFNNNPFSIGLGVISAAAAANANRPQNFSQPQFNNRPQFQDQFQPQFQPQFQTFSDGSSRSFSQPQFQATASTPAAPSVTYSNLPIVLRCSSSAANQCNYKLTEATGVSYPYNIAPGKKQVFNETTRWELSFDRGDGQQLRYTLSGGEIYELKQVDGLWVCHCAS